MSYLSTNHINRAREFLPNIVTIMLGSNDARSDYYSSISLFVEDYKELVRIIQEFETKPDIFLIKPPPIFANIYNHRNANLVNGIIPRIEQVANELDLPVIDVYTTLIDHPEYFPDGLHPNSQGASIIAEEIYKAIILHTENQ
jgi:lysophospholipase L1-like esterase